MRKAESAPAPITEDQAKAVYSEFRSVATFAIALGRRASLKDRSQQSDINRLAIAIEGLVKAVDKVYSLYQAQVLSLESKLSGDPIANAAIKKSLSAAHKRFHTDMLEQLAEIQKDKAELDLIIKTEK